ncbi:MAG: type II toxin-antitoxin system PemK/MazF family toxin [Clostridia bacterium]|nr:type II toxin-antitoxin system PemK/MazF family toxin [Clostridia bacterium]
MVKQGDIIIIDLNPRTGHEQSGSRPAVVVSNDFFNQKTDMTLICPVTSTNRAFPLHIPLDKRTKTKGNILCEHIRAVDLNARQFRVAEHLPEDLLERVIEVLHAQIDIQ